MMPQIGGSSIFNRMLQSDTESMVKELVGVVAKTKFRVCWRGGAAAPPYDDL